MTTDNLPNFHVPPQYGFGLETHRNGVLCLWQEAPGTGSSQRVELIYLHPGEAEQLSAALLRLVAEARKLASTKTKVPSSPSNPELN